MRKKNCDLCLGTGKVMGLGMIYDRCGKCEGSGKIELDKFVCDICQKEIALSAAEKVVEQTDLEVKKQRRKKILEEVSSDGQGRAEEKA